MLLIQIDTFPSSPKSITVNKTSKLRVIRWMQVFPRSSTTRWIVFQDDVHGVFEKLPLHESFERQPQEILERSCVLKWWSSETQWVSAQNWYNPVWKEVLWKCFLGLEGGKAFQSILQHNSLWLLGKIYQTMKLFWWFLSISGGCNVNLFLLIWKTGPLPFISNSASFVVLRWSK